MRFLCEKCGSTINTKDLSQCPICGGPLERRCSFCYAIITEINTKECPHCLTKIN